MTQRLDRLADHQLADVLRSKIISGACLPCSQIPPYCQLRDAPGTALRTVQLAIRMLAAPGPAAIPPTRGTYVRGSICDGDGQTLRAELADLHAALRRSKEDLESAESRIAALLSAPTPEEGVR